MLVVPTPIRPDRSPAGTARGLVVASWVLVVAVAGGLVLGGCIPSGTSHRRAGPTNRAVSAPQPVPSVIARPPSTGLAVAVEPADGDQVVDRLVADAAHTVDVTIYELDDPTVEALLVADRRRGVRVRVLLDRAGSGGSVNQAAATDLISGGVSVRWGPVGVLLHQKTVTVDGRTSAVMTGNLVADDGPTRDFVIVDRVPAAVASIESVFTYDWEGDPPAPVAGVAGLVWSPGAGPAVVGLIASARRSVAVETEEMDDGAVEEALMAAARRGVRVTVTMTADPEWDGALGRLAAAGVHVTTHPDRADTLYLHAKVVVVDDAIAFVGSQNISWSSLHENRELGVITSQPSVVATVAATVAGDAASGTAFEPSG